MKLLEQRRGLSFLFLLNKIRVIPVPDIKVTALALALSLSLSLSVYILKLVKNGQEMYNENVLAVF